MTYSNILINMKIKYEYFSDKDSQIKIENTLKKYK